MTSPPTTTLRERSRAGRLLSAIRRFPGWRLRCLAQRLISRWRMSRHAFVFDRYKRQREASCHLDGTRLRTPSVPGLVSIVLPVFNGADLVRESLDSIRAQTYPDFEVIAINDGSTDGTGPILDEYAARDPRITVIHQENRRLPRTLSRGFAAARGELLTWTSADNRLKPGFLEKMVGCLRRHPDWDMVYANVDIIGEDGEPLRDSHWYRNYQVPDGSEHVHLPADPSELNVYPNNYVGAAFLYRNHVKWLLGDYGRQWFTAEDYDYLMRVNALLTLRHADFDDPVYDYRFHSRSLTARDDELGITRNRVKLMVFEDARRDHYLSPMVWRIVEDGGATAAAVGHALRARISAAGHLLVDGGELRTWRLPSGGLPVVVVHIADTPEGGRLEADGVPRHACRVLVLAGDGELPPAVDEAWNLCLAARDVEQPPDLGAGHRGWIAARDPQALFAVIDIRARSRWLRVLEVEIADPPSPAVDASAVICVHQSSERLQRAVASLARQTLSRSRYEVLVVNNNPSDASLRAQIEALGNELFGDRPERFRWVDCPTSGLSHARNAGISEARGEIICFLDDDAMASEQWLESAVDLFAEHPQAGVIGGSINLCTPDPAPPVIGEGWGRFWSDFRPSAGAYTVATSWRELPWGANWCARRSVLVATGGFRSSYGRTGTDFSGGEEIIAASLAQRLGYEIAVAPELAVDHDVDPSRYTLHHVRRTVIAGAMVTYQAERDLYLPPQSSILYTIWHIVNPRSNGTDAAAATARGRLRLWLWRREALLRVLIARIRDFVRRLRRPAALADHPQPEIRRRG